MQPRTSSPNGPGASSEGTPSPEPTQVAAPKPGTPAGAAPDTRPGDPAWRGDPRQALSEIDAIDGDLKPRASGEVPPPSASAYLEDSPAPEEMLSPYLEERLKIAAASAFVLTQGLRSPEGRWAELEAAATRLESELGNAAREIRFLRLRREMPDAVPAPAVPVAGETRAGAPPPTGPGDVPYGRYTAERYNRTIDAVKARRRSVVAWTLVLAAAISGCLLTLTVVAKEATPPIWLAVLPAIWLIPVPFFIISFLATHRVLRRNHLNVSDGA